MGRPAPHHRGTGRASKALRNESHCEYRGESRCESAIESLASFTASQVPHFRVAEAESYWEKCVDLCVQEHFFNKDCYPMLPRTEHERQAFEEFYSNPANVPEKTVQPPGRGRTPERSPQP